MSQIPFIQYVGKTRHVVAYVVAGGRLVNVAACSTVAGKKDKISEGNMVEARPQSELLDLYDGFELELRQILQV